MAFTYPTTSVYQHFEAMGYFHCRSLPEGKIAANMDMLTTRAIIVGLDSYGYERRYCYQDREEATRELERWDGTGHPGGNWIKLKGTYNGEAVDMLNPEWSQR